MRLRSYFTLILLSVFSVSQASATEKASTAMIGKKMPSVKFIDDKGNTQSLADLKSPKAIVVVFLSFECPVSNNYAPVLSDLAKEYGPKGVHFVALTCNQDENPVTIAKQSREFGLPFPAYLDKGFRAAEALNAETTPEAFVLDSDRVVRYRGRIDDAYYARLKKHGTVKSQDLRNALSDVVAGKPVRTEATVAVGCPIPRHEIKVTDGKVTYHRDVLPILQNNCQQCHRPGEVGPFSLMTYKQAVSWADLIKEYTQKKLMPPWKPTESVPFHNERHMPQKDIDTLAAWVDGGMPEGDPKDAPTPRTFTEGWQLGTPDVVLTANEEFTLGPKGNDLFRCFVLPTHLKDDHYIVAVEVRPSNPRVVHHVLLFIDGTGQGRKLEEKTAKDRKPREDNVVRLDDGPGYTVAMGVGFTPQGGLGGWVPGQIGRYLPEGTGYYLPKGSDVIMQVHYHRNGRTEKDKTQVGLYFAKKPVERPLQSGVVSGGSGTGPFRLFFSIPAGEEKFKLIGDMYARDDFSLLTITPHMHMVGKQIKLTMTPPGGEKKTLLYINEWDYNWQETYTLKAPLAVKKGTHFQVEAVYDNSEKNPNNPFSPPRRITFGEETFNEMCFVFLAGTSNTSGIGPTRRLPLSATPLGEKSGKR